MSKFIYRLNNKYSGEPILFQSFWDKQLVINSILYTNFLLEEIDPHISYEPKNIISLIRNFDILTNHETEIEFYNIELSKEREKVCGTAHNFMSNFRDTALSYLDDIEYRVNDFAYCNHIGFTEIFHNNRLKEKHGFIVVTQRDKRYQLNLRRSVFDYVKDDYKTIDNLSSTNKEYRRDFYAPKNNIFLELILQTNKSIYIRNRTHLFMEEYKV